MREANPSPDGGAELGLVREADATAHVVAVMERPALIGPADVAGCAKLLGAPGASGEQYDRALGLLAAIAYWRPDLLRPGLVGLLERRFAEPAPPDGVYPRLGELLRLLIATPDGPDAVRSVQALLARPDLERAAFDALLDVLGYAASWATPHLDLPALLAIAENERLDDPQRIRLLNAVIEPTIFARLEIVSAPLLKRLIHRFRDHPPLKYLLSYLAGRADAPAEVRALAASAIEGQFQLHDLIAEKLGRGRVAVLVIQNIADSQGDEIIRVVPLLESLLGFNPLLEVALITNRQYLYGHSRLTLVPIDDAASVDAVLRDRFDAVIEFYEPVVLEVNHSQRLEEQVRASVRGQPPFLHVTSRKGWNHFVYERVDVQGRAYADAVGLDRQRVDNVYETTFRLIAELGLPLRLGDESPDADSVVAGLPCQEAEAAWSALTERNLAGRPTALLCPFGGVEPLKGYVGRQADALAARIRDLIREGFYVVLLPNGLPWGSAHHAREVIGRLAPSEQGQVIVAPDPAGGVGDVTYRHAGLHTVPYASYQMRLVTYFVRFADLIVTVEGWMVHAGYHLGKPLRILMLPYSHQSEWHPYGRTLRQGLVIPAAHPALEDTDLPPLPEQPRKFALLSLLRSLGGSGNARAEPLLRRALRSDDRDVRLAAASSLGRLSGPEIDTTLGELLADPAYRVRAAAAGALLDRLADGTAGGGTLQRSELRAHVLIGQDARSWTDIMGLGESARPALTVALRDDDPVIRREAATMMRALDRRSGVASKTRSSSAARDKEGLRRALMEAVPVRGGRRRDGIRLLRRLGRHMSWRDRSAAGQPTVLILTPVKDAADCLDGYVRGLRRLTYPRHLISVGFLESDSSDTTFRDLARHARALRSELRRVEIWKRDFGYLIPPGVPRWAPEIQVERRRVLAMSRNHLLFRALDDEAWVLWIDVDVVEYPPDLIERLLSTGKDIVQPHCVLDYGGPTFDLNAWRDQGRLHLDDLRDEDELVELDAVGGTVLLVKADLHREGLVFPSFLYGTANPRIRTGPRSHFDGEVNGEIETEGLGMMARDMGYRCWGMPRFEVIHRRK
jgi:peptide chain release factor subunit 1